MFILILLTFLIAVFSGLREESVADVSSHIINRGFSVGGCTDYPNAAFIGFGSSDGGGVRGPSGAMSLRRRLVAIQL